MKKNFYYFFTFFLIISFFSTNLLFGQQLLEGQDYKIMVPNINPGGDFLTDEDEKYQMLAILGQTTFMDPRNYSDSYKIDPDYFLFEPNIPEVACFETDTDEESDCETGPSFLNENGMTRVCGPTGCYDRARFEIDANDNPSDTLYGIQISTDDFDEDIRYIDGVTFKPKETRTIDDYKTKAGWEANVFNILGLESETEYSLRITALFGDLTESSPSEIATATTSLGSMEFRIGLAKEDGENINYNPPRTIHFDESFRIIRGAPVRSSDRLIWTLTNSNSVYGISIVQKGEHGGLHNDSGEGYTIESISGDLSAVAEGIGLKNFSTSQLYHTESENGLLGTITVEEEYNHEDEYNVGLIDTIFRKVYESDAPIHTGETSLSIKTKAALGTPEGEYVEELTFVLIAKY